MNKPGSFISQVIHPKLIVIFFAIIALMGCRELVRDEFPDFPQTPVVNSFLVADSVIKVHVSIAGKLDTMPLALVNDALVTCFINDLPAGYLTSIGNGYYTSTTIVQPGNKYRFQVEIPGFPDITGADSIPEMVELTSIEHINQAGVDEEGHSFPAIRVTFPVNPDNIRYYQVTIEVNSYDVYWRSASLKDFSDPVLLAEGLPIAVFSTGMIRDTTYTLQLDYTTGSYSGRDGIMVINLYPLVVEFKSITFQYYQYLKQLYLYETGRFPDFMFGPYHAFPLYSNVSNGMGIVAGYSVYRSEIITPEP